MIYACVIHSTEGGIYVSHNANQGTNSIWTKLANPPRTEGHPLNIRALENGNLLASYSGRRTSNFTASSGVFLSTNSGASWEDRSDDKMKYWTWDVVVDPYDPTENTWYAGVYSGWGGQANGLGGLYKTTNAGVTWTLMKSLQGVTSITFSPSNADVMYVTSEVDGLWYCGNRHDISPTLSQVNSYPFRQPMRVFYNPGDSTELWVSSFGNGMRVGKTSEPTPPAKVTLVHPENHSKPIVKVNELPPHGLFLQWDKVEGASGYRLLLASDSLMQRIVISDSALTDTSMFFTALIDSTYWWKVAAKNELGWGPWSDEWTFSDVTYLDVKDDAVAKSIGLSLYPNPASNEVTVAFNLSEPDRVRIELFDELGRKQQEIASGMLEQGKHTFNMDVSRLIPGPYYLKFAMSNFYRTIPLVLTK
jgi:hypothetical protein